MAEETISFPSGFLSASELLKAKGIGNTAWNEFQKSETALPKIGKKYFEPNGTWLQNMQLENGLKNRKRLLEIEKVDRLSQLGSAEWLPHVNKAKVIKTSGQKWECFGHNESGQLYLLPEEALLLLEMNCIELTWNGVPFSIEQAYEVLINCDNSKCTLNDYRVYSQLVKQGYRLQRMREKLCVDTKSINATKRIVMNQDGFWSSTKSLEESKTEAKKNGSSESFAKTAYKKSSEEVKASNGETTNKRLNIDIISEETLIGNYRIVKDMVPPNSDSVALPNVAKAKWAATRIQRNVKQMPKRKDIASTSQASSSDAVKISIHEKRESSSAAESSPVKKPRPEVIELSDDEIEEIPRPMTKLEVLNSFPNLCSVSVIAQIPRAYIPYNIKPQKDTYRFDKRTLLNLSQTDTMLKSNVNIHNNSEDSHFYSQRNHCHEALTYGANSSYSSYRGLRWQRDGSGSSFFQHNINTHNSYTGTYYQSNMNFVMGVMSNMVRSTRLALQGFQTTFCQNVQIFSHRLPYQQHRYNPYAFSPWAQSPPLYRYSQYPRKGYLKPSPYSGNESLNNSECYDRDDIFQPSFKTVPGVASWSELKRKWSEEKTITIEDEDTINDYTSDNSEIQVVKESVTPLISTKTPISNISDIYERLRIIKSASDKTIRSRKVDYCLTYEVFPPSQHFKKSNPGAPMCRLYILDNVKEPIIDFAKLQRLQQDSKDVPVVVACVSETCISYIQLGLVNLPNMP